jgi:hypothetical protein
MIQIYVIVILVLLVGGLSYYAVNTAFTGMASVVTGAYPTYFTGVGWTFVESMMAWLPFFAIVLACVLFAIVWGQKKGASMIG